MEIFQDEYNKKTTYRLNFFWQRLLFTHVKLTDSVVCNLGDVFSFAYGAFCKYIFFWVLGLIQEAQGKISFKIFCAYRVIIVHLWNKPQFFTLYKSPHNFRNYEEIVYV